MKLLHYSCSRQNWKGTLHVYSQDTVVAETQRRKVVQLPYVSRIIDKNLVRNCLTDSRLSLLMQRVGSCMFVCAHRFFRVHVSKNTAAEFISCLLSCFIAFILCLVCAFKRTLMQAYIRLEHKSWQNAKKHDWSILSCHFLGIYPTDIDDMISTLLANLFHIAI